MLNAVKHLAKFVQPAHAGAQQLPNRTLFHHNMAKRKLRLRRRHSRMPLAGIPPFNFYSRCFPGFQASYGHQRLGKGSFYPNRQHSE